MVARAQTTRIRGHTTPAEMPNLYFSAEFQGLAPAEIARRLETDGIFCMPGALTPEFVREIASDVARVGVGFNQNWITGVYANRQFYLTHMLAASRVFVRLTTDSKIHKVFQALLGSDYRIKAQRYYETYGGHHMQWHTDNKVGRSFAHIPGLIVIAYMSDVADGEFQYIRGSHAWSGDKAYNDYPDAMIDREYKDDVLSFPGPAGTLVIYNTYGIHRARPVKDPAFVRKSLFFQVDAEVGSAEPILLNPEYLAGVDEAMLRFLGFGLPAGHEIYPQTDLSTLPASRVPWRTLIDWGRGQVIAAIPTSIKHPLKRLLRR